MIVTAVTDLVDRLRLGDVRAVADERDVNPPCVLVRPPTLLYTFGGGAQAGWELIAVVPDTGTGPALAALDVLVDAARAALSGDVTTATPTSYAQEQGAPLPAYRLTLRSDL